MLPVINSNSSLDDRNEREKQLLIYQKKCEENNMTPLRFMESIKLLAKDYNIPVFVKETVKDEETKNWLKKLKLDLIVLGGGWPELIPVDIIRIPKAGMINTHPSLLPEFRGTDIHRWQVLHGVKKSGTTIHYIDESFDTGDILGQAEVTIDKYDTPQVLFEKNSKIAGPLMEQVLKKIQDALPYRLKGVKQASRDNSANYYSRWSWNPEKLHIKWNKTANQILRFILAHTQESYVYNGPLVRYENNNYIIRSASVTSIRNGKIFELGEIISITDEGLLINTKKECLLVKKIQPATDKGYPTEPNTSKVLAGSEIKKSSIFTTHQKFTTPCQISRK